jgi:ribonuclease Y
MSEFMDLFIFAGKLGINHIFGKKKEINKERFDNLKELIIKEAKEEADKIIREAKEEAEALIKSAKEIDSREKERYNFLSELEKRLQEREKILAYKESKIEEKERKYEDYVEKVNAVNRLRLQLTEELEKISELDKKSAKELLLKLIEDELRPQIAKILKEKEEEVKRDVENRAKDILITAIQRYLPTQIDQLTTTTLYLDREELKGRIIGREGRNIRTLETVCGVDIIIDDTPNTIVISAYDNFRREVAKISLERLLMRGQVHPGSIEETVKEVEAELKERSYSEVEKMLLDMQIYDLAPQIKTHLAELKFRTSFSQNVLAHSREVAEIATLIAAELGADVNITKRAGLLHDIGKTITDLANLRHTEAGAAFLKKHGEKEEVVHAVAAHHEDIKAKTIEAAIIQVADSISASRPGVRKENFERYLQRIETLEKIARSFQQVEKAFAIHGGKELRVITTTNSCQDEELPLLARKIADKIETEAEYPAPVKVVAIKETRAIDYAR